MFVGASKQLKGSWWISFNRDINSRRFTNQSILPVISGDRRVPNGEQDKSMIMVKDSLRKEPYSA